MKNIVKLVVLTILPCVGLTAVAAPALVFCSLANNWSSTPTSVNGVSYYTCTPPGASSSQQLWCGSWTASDGWAGDSPVTYSSLSIGGTWGTNMISNNQTVNTASQQQCAIWYANASSCAQSGNWQSAGTTAVTIGSLTQNIPYYTCNEVLLGNRTLYCSNGAGVGGESFYGLLGINLDISQNTLINSGTFPCGTSSVSQTSCASTCYIPNYLNNSYNGGN